MAKRTLADRRWHDRHPAYSLWLQMRNRCLNPNDTAYKNYGGRGISVCERWRISYPDFIADMGPRPSLEHSLDRYPDNNGDYEPGNVRWATPDEQAMNKRSNRQITYKGETKILRDWARAVGLKPGTLHRRLYHYGWSVEQALTQPLKIGLFTHNGKTDTLRDWAHRAGMNTKTLESRIQVWGWSFDRAISTPTRHDSRWHGSARASD